MRRRRGGERGSGPISTALEFAVFLAFLLLAMQFLLGLYTSSVVTAVASDAAHRAAASGGDHAALVQVEAEARRQLGRAGARARFDWSIVGEADEVVLRVQAPRPTIVPVGAGRGDAGDVVERTVRARVERFRAP